MGAREKQIAKSLGVTPAGLAFLARLKATGKAPQRGNEASRLLSDGLIAEAEVRFRNYEAAPFLLTDAGCDVVKRARALGF